MLKHRPVRFAFAGGINTLVGVALFPLLDTLLAPLGVPYLATLVLCHFLAVTQAYYLNRVFVFRSDQKPFLEFVLFSAFQWIYLLINLAALPALVALTGRDPRLVQVGISLVAMVSSYLWQAHVVFRKVSL